MTVAQMYKNSFLYNVIFFLPKLIFPFPAHCHVIIVVYLYEVNSIFLSWNAKMTVQTRQSSTILLLHSSYYLLHRIWLWWARLTYITQRAKNGPSSNDLTGLTAADAAG